MNQQLPPNSLTVESNAYALLYQSTGRLLKDSKVRRCNNDLEMSRRGQLNASSRMACN